MRRLNQRFPFVYHEFITHDLAAHNFPHGSASDDRQIAVTLMLNASIMRWQQRSKIRVADTPLTSSKTVRCFH